MFFQNEKVISDPLVHLTLLFPKAIVVCVLSYFDECVLLLCLIVTNHLLFLLLFSTVVDLLFVILYLEQLAEGQLM